MGISQKYAAPPSTDVGTRIPRVVFRVLLSEARPRCAAMDVETGALHRAETSLTIADVVYVVDAGKLKERRHNAARGMSALVEDFVSQASATAVSSLSLSFSLIT